MAILVCENLETRLLLSINLHAIGVFADSSQWQASFLGSISDQGVGSSNLGYKIPLATAQTKTLPWTNIDTLSVQFDQNVSLKPTQISLTGSPDPGFSTPPLTSATFSYNSSTFVATWVFPTSLPDNKYLLTIPVAATSPGPELANTFAYAFNILPGDVDRNGSTNVLDTVKTRNLQFTTATDGGSYSIFSDVDGSGSINVLDTVKVRNLQFTLLPTSDPVAPSVTPSFLLGANETVTENSSRQYFAGWATNIRSGVTGQSGQSLSFAVSNNNANLFASQPTIAADGSLAFTPAVNASGMATVAVSLTNNSNAGGNNTSSMQKFTITVKAVDQTLRTILADYDLVHNAVAFQAYYGEMKGPMATAETKAGNAWDQAAYLQQQLQSDGFTAQLVTGLIEVDGSAAAQWLGTTASDGSITLASVQAASNILSQSELLTKSADIDSSNPSNSRFFIQHAWVQVTTDTSAGTFALDPSWKYTRPQPGIPNVLTDVPYNFKDYTSAADPLRSPSQELASEYYEDQIADHLRTSNPGKTLADVPHTGPIIASLSQSLPTYPYVLRTSNSAAMSFDDSDQHHVSITIRDGTGTKTLISKSTYSVPDLSRGSIRITYATAPGVLGMALLVNNRQVGNILQFKAGSQIQIVVDADDPGFSGPEYTFNSEGSGGREYTFLRTVGQDAVVTVDAGQTSPAYLASLQNTILASEQTYVTNAQSAPALVDNILQYTGMRYWDEYNTQTGIIDALTSAVEANDQVGVGLVTNSLKSGNPVLANKPNSLYVNTPYNVLVDMPGITAAPEPLDGSNTFDGVNRSRFDLIATNASSLENQIIEEVNNAPSISTVKGLYLASTSGNVVQTIAAGTPSATVKKDLSTYPATIESQIAADVAAGYTITLPTKLVSEGRWSGAVYYEEKFDSESVSIGFIINDGVAPAHGGSEDNLPTDPSYPLSSAPTITHEQVGGDPIGLASGNVQHVETDLSLPDFGLPLTFGRQYDSSRTTDGGLGVGWVSNYGDSLTLSSTNAVWNTSDGHSYTFALSKGVFKTPDQLSGNLTLTSGIYTYTEKGGFLRRFKVVTGSTAAQLVELRDRNDNTFEITRNSAAAVASVSDTQNSAYKLTFSYDSTKHLSQILDPTGRTWSYSYAKLSDGKYYLTQVVSPADASTPALVTNYAYFDKTSDASLLLLGLLNTVTKTDVTNDPSDPRITKFTYYPDRRGFQVTDPDGNTTAVNYKLFRNTAEFVDERGNVTTTTYSHTTGLTLKQVNPDQTRDLYAYTPVHHLLASHTDPLGDTTTYAYDYGASDTEAGVGNLVQSIDDATGTATNYTYEPAAKFYQVATVAVVSGATTELTQYAHDAQGNTTSVTDPAGDVTTLTYGPRGEVLSRTTPSGNVAQPAGNYTTNFTYNAVGQVLTTTLPSLINATQQPTTTKNTYDTHYALASATDATGVVTTYANDLLGHHLSQTLPDPDGSGPLGPSVTTVQYDAYGNRISITDPRGLVTQQAFDAKNKPIAVIHPNGTKTTNGYDPSGNLTQTTDPLGNVTLSVFDLMGRPVEIVNPDGTTRFIQYAANGAVALAIDENGYATSAAYDAAGRLTSATDANGNISRNTYDGFNNLLKVAFYPAGLSGGVYSATSYQYDLLNRIVQSQGPQGTFQTTAYDPDGNVVRQVRYDVTGYTYDPTGVTPGLSVALSSLPASQQQVTTTAYDVADRPVQVSEPILAGFSGPLTTSTSYDAAGRVLSTADERGLKTAYGYDAAGRQVSVTAPNPAKTAQPGLTTTSTLDADGNTLATTDPAGNVTTSTYDLKSNRPIAVATGTASTYTTFDGDNNVVATTDGEGNRTVDTYDSRNRLVSESQPAPGGMVLNFYDPASRLIKTVDADGRRTDYGYDALNRKTSETWYATAAGGTPLNQITWAYNAANQLASVSDNSGTTSYTYDTASRVLTQTDAYAGQAAVTYAYRYDGLGNVAERDATVGGTGVQKITYQFNAENRLTQETSVTPGGFTNASAAVTQMVNYTLNADGQPTTIARYQATGGAAAVLVAATMLAYDNDGRVTGITHQQGTTTLDGYQYAYNNASQTTGVTSALDGTTGYTYDTAGEIATTTYSANSAFNENYAFDGAGNSTANSTTGDNRLVSDNTFAYTYDAAGNIDTRTRLSSAAASDYVTLYTWDNRNRLIEVVNKNNAGTVTQDVTYAYDTQNRRIAETVNGVSTFFSYADDDNVALTLNGSGVATAVLYGPDNLEVSEVDASNAVRWMLTDAQGSVRDVVTLSGTTAQVADHLAYNSFGKVLTETNPATPHLLGYAGQQPDAAVGLNYDRARYYNPQTGRFVSQDPSGLAAGDANLYRYVANDPVDFVDPSGLHIQLPDEHEPDFDSEGLSLPSYSVDNSSYNSTLDLSTLQGSGYGSAESSTQPNGSFSQAFTNSLNASQTEAENAADTLVNGNLNWFQKAAVYSDLAVSELWTPSTYQYTLLVAGGVGGLAAASLFGVAAEGGVLTGIFNDAAAGSETFANSAGISPVINPADVAGKTPAEIDAFARQIGLVAKGNDPMNGQGSYIDPITGEQRILSHPYDESPHAHVNDVFGGRLDINGNSVLPESPEAHLPIKVNP